MGIFTSKHKASAKNKEGKRNNNNENAIEKTWKKKNHKAEGKKPAFMAFYTGSPAKYLFRTNPSPKRLFRRAFEPLSPAHHMKGVLVRRTGKGGGEKLNKSFGFSKHIGHKYEIGEEVGKGYFGHTCRARCKKGEFKGQQVAVKIISKSEFCFC